MASVNLETVGQWARIDTIDIHTQPYSVCVCFFFIRLIKITATSTHTFSMINECVIVAIVWSSYFIHVIEKYQFARNERIFFDLWSDSIQNLPQCCTE